jgi:uncharacterized membrane protein (DUF2068 family)
MPVATHVDKSHTTHVKGLRTVAMIEALKGVLVLAVAFALIALLRHDVDLQDAAMNVLDFLHIDPDRRLAGLFIDAAGKVMDWNVIFVGLGAFAYSALRFIEAYGLWRERVWAEWLAIISGSLYIPMEVIELLRRATPMRWSLLIINLIVVAYIAWVRYDEHRTRTAALPVQISNPSPR